MKTKEFSTRRPQHLVARVVCLLLAVVAWLCVMRVSDPEYDKTLNGVAITIENQADSAYTATLDKETVDRVRIHATRAVLAELEEGDVVAYVDMTELPHDVNLQESELYELPLHFATPEGVTIDGDYKIRIQLGVKA